MKAALKFLGICIGTTLFLCMTISDRPIFNYIYDVISPLTRYAQKMTTYGLNQSIIATQDFSKKIFQNSVPKVKDSVKSKLAANYKDNAPASEEINSEEKAQLNDLIKNH